MNKRQMLSGLAAMLCLAGGGMAAGPEFAETRAERDARMKWWRDARFGMFIHWGLYAVPAKGEWYLYGSKEPLATYRAYANQFNPVKWDADAVASLAKKAGMKYIVITAKHHEGFAMWPTKVEGFSLNATPFRRDPLRELKDACVRHGLKFGLYYSHGQDWTAPSGGMAMAGRRWWDPAQTNGTFEGYAEKIAIPHCWELLENYRPDLWWWDSSVWMWGERDERTAMMYDVFKPYLKNIILNNRWHDGLRSKQFDSAAWFAGAEGMDHFVHGDYASPECRYPTAGHGKDSRSILPPDGVDWETCTSIQWHWGYNATAKERLSAAYIVRVLVHCASQGGNFLLNIGPTAEGVIPQPSVDRLEEVGRWTAVYGESIYGTKGGPIYNVFTNGAVGSGKDFPQPWDAITDYTRKEGKLFVHVYQLAADRTVRIPPLKNKVDGITLLRDPSVKIPYIMKDDAMVVTVPASVTPNPVDEVLVVSVDGWPEKRGERK